ncbi:hypothetical protein [Mesobacterium pallidum]|uniref:hypothetical protein n=1 Tax=Mesobacterium pallidum TaxID=2872037 RepID=UPI001EE33CC5|nr:hypothetical protein [Mesobacterium pallidum]
MTQSTARTPRTEAIAREVAALAGPCVGCSDCKGLCQALIDAICVPEVILSGRQTG